MGATLLLLTYTNLIITMDLKQSWILSVAKTSLTLYEQRILVRIVEHGQVVLSGLFLQEHLEHIPHTFKHEQVAFPVNEILTEGTKHYEQVYAAAEQLSKRRVEFWNADKTRWAFSNIIFDVRCGDGVLSFYVSNTFWDVLFDFTMGFSWYDLKIALTLPTAYAIKLYMILNGQKSCKEYSINQLKECLGCASCYSQTADFIKKVIEPSRKALDEAGGNSFTYHRVKKGQKVVALQFFPVIKQKMNHQPANKHTFWAAMVPKEIKIQLITQAGFTSKELSAHEELIGLLSERTDACELLSGIINRARVKERSKGYIIAALRGELHVGKKISE